MNDQSLSIGENIRLLGSLLGEIIVENAGQEVYELEEELRMLSKAWHDGDESVNQRIHDLIVEISEDLGKSTEILKAFATYFSLVNLAEEHQRIDILRSRSESAFQNDEALDESVLHAIEVIKREGFSGDQVAELLQQMFVMPVFTAHPTESKRRTTRQILRYLSENLFDFRSPSTRDHQRPTIQDNMKAAITLLWQSDDSRKRKPTVMDEVRNTGLYFVENALFDEVPRVYEELESALSKHYPDREWHVPSLLRLGSWIGGDRDGNPFVTNDTTQLAIQAQQKLVLERYERDVNEIYELLSPSRSRAKFDPEFLQSLEEDRAAAPEKELEVLERFAEEPYRQKLILVFRRLHATMKQQAQDWNEFETVPRAYLNSAELVDDLDSIRQSLVSHAGESLARGKLERLIRRVDVFGFHLATLDIRQHSAKHEDTIHEIFERYEIQQNYRECNDDERATILTREILNRRPLTSTLDFSEPTNQMVSLFRLIRQAHQCVGSMSIGTYIISMSESQTDMLEVLLLLSDAGLEGQLDIVPLFETIEDLKAAPEIMKRLFQNEAYRTHLKKRGDQQQIMIGYSDSNKDGGFLRANWMLFLAQRQLAEVCNQNEIRMTLFHGRGGSIGRGGGPANRSILSQPPESIRGRIRITEQGEVVSSRYSHREIAFRHLQQMLHAVVCSSGRRPSYDKLPTWSQIIEELSALAFSKYRSLVEQDEFIEYFHAATPIDQIDQWNLGSRPSRRKQTESIADLRAIPWVFAWTQSRTNIPSWFGVGTAIRDWLQNSENENRIEMLQAMYAEWPFFQSLLNNVHLGIGRADLQIASLYSDLAANKGVKNVFAEIQSEFELTQSGLLQVTGHKEILDTEPWLKHSIRMRNPYVDPMNYLQVALLERFRQSTDPEEQADIQQVILQSINGIAAGLQNVG